MNEDELEHWWQVMRTLQNYSDFFEEELARRQRHINKLSERHLQRLPDITLHKLEYLNNAAKQNQFFLDDMVYYHATHAYIDPPQSILQLHKEQQDKKPPSSDQKNEEIAASEGDEMILPTKELGPMISVDQQHRNMAVLHSIYREWSEEGAQERKESFQLILSELQRL